MRPAHQIKKAMHSATGKAAYAPMLFHWLQSKTPYTYKAHEATSLGTMASWHGLVAAQQSGENILLNVTEHSMQHQHQQTSNRMLTQ